MRNEMDMCQKFCRMSVCLSHVCKSVQLVTLHIFVCQYGATCLMFVCQVQYNALVTCLSCAMRWTCVRSFVACLYACRMLSHCTYLYVSMMQLVSYLSVRVQYGAPVVTCLSVRVHFLHFCKSVQLVTCLYFGTVQLVLYLSVRCFTVHLFVCQGALLPFL